MVKQAVKFFDKQVATPVFGSGEAWQVGEREELAQNRALQILTQELPLELRHGIRAVQGEIGGEDGTAGDAVYEVDFREQRFGFAITSHRRRRQCFQHTVAEGSRTRAAAGEKEDEQQAVVVLCGIESRFQAVTATAVNVINSGERLIFDKRTGGKEERQQEEDETAHGQARWVKKRMAIRMATTISAARNIAK